MPSDQSQAIAYGKPLEPGTFDFTAGGATASLNRAPNAFLTKARAAITVEHTEQRARVPPAGTLAGSTR